MNKTSTSSPADTITLIPDIALFSRSLLYCGYCEFVRKLKKVDGLESDDEFYRMMIGDDYSEENLQEEINSISPASLVDEDSVPTLLGYGLIDHCVPLTQKYYLLDSLKKYNVTSKAKCSNVFGEIATRLHELDRLHTLRPYNSIS